MRVRRVLIGFVMAILTACSVFSGSDKPPAESARGSDGSDADNGGDAAPVSANDGASGEDAASDGQSDASPRKRAFLAQGNATGATALTMCNIGATALGGHFVPWLGRADGTSPLSTVGAGPWFLVDPKTLAADPSALVAAGPSQLVDGGVTNAIKRDHLGNGNNTPFVFTGTLADAAATPTKTCTDWTDGTVGSSAATTPVGSGALWTGNGATSNCASSGTTTSVYCFED